MNTASDVDNIRALLMNYYAYRNSCQSNSLASNPDYLEWESKLLLALSVKYGDRTQVINQIAETIVQKMLEKDLI